VQERELLARLSVFPRGITVELLGMLVDAGGQVAGVLVNARPALARLLQRLVDRGLVFRYAAADGTLNWTALPSCANVSPRCSAARPKPCSTWWPSASAKGLRRGRRRNPKRPPCSTATSS
jgi:hypothetical protein